MMDETMTPHRGVSIVIKGPGRRSRLGMIASKKKFARSTLSQNIR